MFGARPAALGTLLLIAATLAVAFWIDFALLPQYPIAVLYEVPVLVAALRLRWVGVTVTALAATVVCVTSQALRPADLGLWVLYFGGFLFASALCVAIAAHRERYAEQVWRLVAAESRFLGVFDEVFDAVVVAHASGYVAQINAAAEALFGYDRHAAVGLPLTMLLSCQGDAPARRGAPSVGHQLAEDAETPRWSIRKKSGSVLPAQVRHRELSLDDRTMHVYVIRV